MRTVIHRQLKTRHKIRKISPENKTISLYTTKKSKERDRDRAATAYPRSAV